MNKKTKSSVSKHWQELNLILKAADEALCRKLLEKERKGLKRAQFLRRIYSRLNKVRAARERIELDK